MTKQFIKPTKRVIPLFKYDPENLDKTIILDETENGERGKSILVRKYINDLDMNFYAGRSSEKGRESIPITLRVPEDVAKDIGIMIATQKTRFRDRSEFIRTAIYILLNYYAPIVEGQFKECVGLRKTEDLIEWERLEGLRIRKIIESFDNQFEAVAENGNEVLHKYLTKIANSIEDEKRPHIRDKLVKAFTKRMRRGNIDPSEYFKDYKNIKD